LEKITLSMSHNEFNKLIDNGEKALGEFQPELAIQFFSRALLQDGESTRVLDLLGETSVQVGEPERACEYFLKSSQLAPDENPYKWLYLGQLQEAEASVASFRKGIAMLSALAQGTSDMKVREKLGKEVGKAYCNVAEMYMTDLCMEDDAEQQCEEAIRHATQHDASSLDLGLTLSNLRLSQSRPEEACTAIEVVYTRIVAALDAQVSKPILSAFRADPAQGASTGVAASSSSVESSGEGEADEVMPDPELCVSVVKRLIECAAVKPALGLAAMEVAQRLLLLDDSNVELWYLTGVACLYCSPPEVGSAVEALVRAKEMLEAMAKMGGGSRKGGVKMPEELECQYGLVCENLAAAEAMAEEGVAMDEDDDNDNEDEDEEDAEWEAS
jgi:tetratricopeptide (TPR) repeat protein